MYEIIVKLNQKIKDVFDESVRFFLDLGFHLLDQGVLHHDKCGGKSCRSRVCPVFEETMVNSRLPPWDSSSDNSSPEVSCIADALTKVELLDRDSFQHGKMHRLAQPRVRKGEVIQVGEL